MSIKARLFTAASQSPPLQTLLQDGSPGIFRWYDTQLPQQAAFPCVVVQAISNPADYVLTGRMPTSWQRIQLTIYGTGNDSQNANLVVEALTEFLDAFNATRIVGQVAQPTYIVGDRDGGIAQTNPLTYQRFVDVRLYVDSSI